MRDRALEISTPYKLAMMSLLFFIISVAQLEAEISTYIHVGGGYVGPAFTPVLIEI